MTCKGHPPPTCPRALPALPFVSSSPATPTSVLWLECSGPMEAAGLGLGLSLCQECSSPRWSQVTLAANSLRCHLPGTTHPRQSSCRPRRSRPRCRHRREAPGLPWVHLALWIPAPLRRGPGHRGPVCCAHSCVPSTQDRAWPLDTLRPRLWSNLRVSFTMTATFCVLHGFT